MTIPETIEAQRSFFLSGATLRRGFREAMLRRLLDALDIYEDELYAALWKDLHKSRQEAYLTETGIVRSEIRTHLRQLRSWMKPERHLPSAAVGTVNSRHRCNFVYSDIGIFINDMARTFVHDNHMVGNVIIIRLNIDLFRLGR